MKPVALATRIEVAQGQALVYAEGDVDLESSAALRQALSTALASSDSVTVDVADVGFIDSSGLSVLVWGHGRAQESGGSLRLRRPSPMLRRLLEITSLDSVLAIADSEDHDRAASES